jgi:hypothetical protein
MDAARNMAVKLFNFWRALSIGPLATLRHQPQLFVRSGGLVRRRGRRVLADLCEVGEATLANRARRPGRSCYARRRPASLAAEGETGRRASRPAPIAGWILLGRRAFETLVISISCTVIKSLRNRHIRLLLAD